MCPAPEVTIALVLCVCARVCLGCVSDTERNQAAVKAISKSRKKAGDAVGKMIARGKFFAPGKALRSGSKSRGAKMMRNAVATVKAQNEIARDQKEHKPRIRVWVERLMAKHR